MPTGSRLWTLGFVLPVLLLVLWQVASVTGLADRNFLPPLQDLVVRFVNELTTGTLALDLGLSLLRDLAGFVIGSLIGVGTGLRRLTSPFARGQRGFVDRRPRRTEYRLGSERFNATIKALGSASPATGSVAGRFFRWPRAPDLSHPTDQSSTACRVSTTCSTKSSARSAAAFVATGGVARAARRNLNPARVQLVIVIARANDVVRPVA